MDYEKKYKEALERARQFSEKPYLEDSKGIVDYIFPELKESEDERIRKAMIDFFKHEREEGITVLHYGVNIERIIAWLEKCAPKKHNDVGQYIKLNSEQYSFMIPSDLYPRLDGYNQQLWRNEIEYAYSNGRKDERKECEQKPVECCADKLWTEFQKQVAYLMASSYNREYEYTKGYVEWVAQSLLGYAKNEIEQKPAEWSDDDEAFLDDILCKVESNLLLNKDEKNWLKSLRPQKQWKPSDEQMEFLQKYAEQNNYDGRILTSLYNDLKKIKKIKL